MAKHVQGNDIVPVVIIGAGESGIALACRLRSELKIPATSIRVYERQSGLGGTWHINRYPGVACDVPSVFYSFSFNPNPHWSQFYAEGDEIRKYLENTAEKYGVSGCIATDVDVEGCTWDAEKELWIVRLRHMTNGLGDLSAAERKSKIEEWGENRTIVKTETVMAKVVCSCVGGLVEPKSWPDSVPGLDKFEGQVFHSARWRYDIDLKDKNVVVMGTGCSAAQFVPRLTTEYGAKSVTQVMRSPPWVEPRAIPPGGDDGWNKWAPWLSINVPLFNRGIRGMMFAGAEAGFKLFGTSDSSVKFRLEREAALIKRMKKMVPEKYHEILTPDYGVGCKRRIFDRDWFESLNNPKIELTTLKFSSVNPHSITLGPGRTFPAPENTTSSVSQEEKEVPADVIVLANGFEVSKWLHPLNVVGKNGVDLVEEMEARGGPQAYQGTAMDGFPNFFIIFGPNTATGHSSVILASENMITYALKFVKKVLSGEARTVEVHKEAEIAYTRDIQKSLKDTVWASGGCASWYITNDWNGVCYPYSQYHFMWRCMVPKWRDWEIKYTTKGRWLEAVRAGTRILTLALLFTLLYRAREAGVTFRSLRTQSLDLVRGLSSRAVAAVRSLSP